VAVADELGGREELIALRALCKQTDLLFYFFHPHLEALVKKNSSRIPQRNLSMKLTNHLLTFQCLWQLINKAMDYTSKEYFLTRKPPTRNYKVMSRWVAKFREMGG
jgi:hypothetical protein